jgi:hypothetical protein
MPLPPNEPLTHHKPAMQAMLASNSGHAYLQFQFSEHTVLEYSTEIEADISILAPNWTIGWPARSEIKLQNVQLNIEMLGEMMEMLDSWLQLPLNELAARKLRGTFDLSSRSHQRFVVTFGNRAGLRSEGKPIVSIIVEGGLQAQCNFTTDQSCLQIFVDDLKSIFQIWS